MPVKKKYAALGRGLDALISNEDIRISGSSSIGEVPIDHIKPNPNQPRREFDDESLRELADSIREIGIVQPISVRRLDNGTYQIIAGERRWRAARLVGLNSVPAYIRTADDEKMMQMALVENIQREDLNAIEIALAYQNLAEQYGLKQEEVSVRVGKNRATVANYMRLLKLPAPVQMALKNKEIDQGHARALLSLENPAMQVRLFEEIQREKYSVRKVEELVNRLNSGEDVTTSGRRIRAKHKKDTSETFDSLQKHLSDHFGTNVKMQCSSSGRGKITIHFSNQEEMERIIALLDHTKQ